MAEFVCVGADVLAPGKWLAAAVATAGSEECPALLLAASDRIIQNMPHVLPVLVGNAQVNLSSQHSTSTTNEKPTAAPHFSPHFVHLRFALGISGPPRTDTRSVCYQQYATWGLLGDKACFPPKLALKILLDRRGAKARMLRKREQQNPGMLQLPKSAFWQVPVIRE